MSHLDEEYPEATISRRTNRDDLPEQGPRVIGPNRGNKRRIVVGWNHQNDTPAALRKGRVWCWVAGNSLQVYDESYNRSPHAGVVRFCGVANFTMVRMFHPWFALYGHMVPEDKNPRHKEWCRYQYRKAIRIYAERDRAAGRVADADIDIDIQMNDKGIDSGEEGEEADDDDDDDDDDDAAAAMKTVHSGHDGNSQRTSTERGRKRRVRNSSDRTERTATMMTDDRFIKTCHSNKRRDHDDYDEEADEEDNSTIAPNPLTWPEPVIAATANGQSSANCDLDDIARLAGDSIDDATFPDDPGDEKIIRDMKTTLLKTFQNTTSTDDDQGMTDADNKGQNAPNSGALDNGEKDDIGDFVKGKNRFRMKPEGNEKVDLETARTGDELFMLLTAFNNPTVVSPSLDLADSEGICQTPRTDMGNMTSDDRDPDPDPDPVSSMSSMKSGERPGIVISCSEIAESEVAVNDNSSMFFEDPNPRFYEEGSQTSKRIVRGGSILETDSYIETDNHDIEDQGMSQVSEPR